ncbi:hypothetical protein N9917_00035 [Deltaproteobacteria bacterium]|nr:hypothetical protein [Deltaproteobacteria bacterium]
MTTAENEIERKWLVRQEQMDWPEDQPVESDSDILQTGLQRPDEADGSTERVRRRFFDTGKLELTHTVKHSTDHVAHRIESERTIDEKEYLILLRRKHPDMVQIHKHRRVFVYEGHRFELDSFIKPTLDCLLLECELPSLDTEVTLPPWLPVDREVTDEPGWTNTAIALQGGPPTK